MVSVAGKMLAIHEALDAGGVSHAFGGALALAWCTQQARGTIDICREAGEADALVASNWAGFSLVAFPLAVTWINDTFAYFGGRSRMASRLYASVSAG